MKTKKDRAQAAVRALTNLAHDEQDRDAAAGLYFWAGVLQGYADNAGYLSADRIDETIDLALEKVDGLIHAYYKEIEK
jgi:hypothetical protein